MERQEKVLGSLLASAVGDTMGAATELRPRELILEKFGGPVTEILTPPDDTFARGSKAGSVTDDFSLIYYTARAIANSGGVVSEAAAQQAVLDWAADEKFFDQYAGPTTRAAIDRMQGRQVANYYDFICCDNAKASNGSAMKISPAGLFNPGNLDKAIDDAITLCMPTHSNNLSITGACAVAAAVSCAGGKGADVYKIVQAGLYGARQGSLRTKGNCAVLAGPSVEKRICLAVDIALRAATEEQVMEDIADLVGTGIHISEAVPAVFGILVATGGDTMKGITMAVNIGSDTDTIATMVGAITGAMNGTKGIPPEYLPLIEEVNGFDIEKLAADITAIVGQPCAVN